MRGSKEQPFQQLTTDGGVKPSELRGITNTLSSFILSLLLSVRIFSGIVSKQEDLTSPVQKTQEMLGLWVSLSWASARELDPARWRHGAAWKSKYVWRSFHEHRVAKAGGFMILRLGLGLCKLLFQLTSASMLPLDATYSSGTGALLSVLPISASIAQKQQLDLIRIKHSNWKKILKKKEKYCHLLECHLFHFFLGWISRFELSHPACGDVSSPALGMPVEGPAASWQWLPHLEPANHSAEPFLAPGPGDQPLHSCSPAQRRRCCPQ